MILELDILSVELSINKRLFTEEVLFVAPRPIIILLPTVIGLVLFNKYIILLELLLPNTRELLTDKVESLT